MNIFIKHFYIFSILIGLNSSMIVHIHIDKNELIQKGNEFRLRMVKRSEDGTKWELARNANKNSEGKLMKAANYASIIVPLEWEKIYKKSIKDNEPFWLAIKVIITMIGNKMIEIDPLPFILKKDNQHLYIDLTKLENGKIIGSIYEATSSNDGHNRVEQMPAHHEILESSNVSSLPLQNAQNPHGNFMGKSKLPNQKDSNPFNLSTHLHKSNPQQEMMAHQQLGRPNYFKDEGKIQQLSKEWEKGKGKRTFSEISDDDEKPFLVNQSKHFGPKLLQSSIDASQKQSKKGGKNNSQQELVVAKQKLGINKMISQNYPKDKVKIQRILREVENTNKRAFSEIGGNEPQFVKLLQPADGPKLLQSSINASHGQSRNEGKQQQGNQREFTQINSSGFTHHGHHKAIKDEPEEHIGEWQQNLPIQTAKTSSSSFDAIGGSQQYDGRKGKAPSNIDDPLAEQQNFRADDDAEDWDESDLANLFTFDD